MFKPLPRREFERIIRKVGWYLEKGSIDWKLRDQNGNFVCTIKITHPGPPEIPPGYVKHVKRVFKERGLIWDQQKK